MKWLPGPDFRKCCTLEGYRNFQRFDNIENIFRMFATVLESLRTVALDCWKINICKWGKEYFMIFFTSPFFSSPANMCLISMFLTDANKLIKSISEHFLNTGTFNFICALHNIPKPRSSRIKCFPNICIYALQINMQNLLRTFLEFCVSHMPQLGNKKQKHYNIVSKNRGGGGIRVPISYINQN